MPGVTKETLIEMLAVDTTARWIDQKDLIELKCRGCDNIGSPKWVNAIRSKSAFGHYFQCDLCRQEKSRNSKKVIFKTEYLQQLGLIDTSERGIAGKETPDIYCTKCKTIGNHKKWPDIITSYDRNGWGYRCENCGKDSYIKRSQNEQWLAGVTAAAQNRPNMIGNTHSKTYYWPEVELKLKAAGLFSWSGEFKNSASVFTITWSDGIQRTDRIQRLMEQNFRRPKENVVRTNAQNRLREMGLSIIKIDDRYAGVTYKNQTWTQRWYGYADKCSIRYMVRVDKGLKLQELISSGMTIQQACKQEGVDFNAFYRGARLGKSVIEVAMNVKRFEAYLSIDGAVVNGRLSESYKIRPDLRIEEHKLIIEVDGMYWHSEELKSRSHHFKRWELFNKEGYSFLGFSEYEVKEKPSIVNSMIDHRMGKSTKIYANKTVVREVDTKQSGEFFQRCHLKGVGSGKTLGLYYEDKLVCALRYVIKNDQIHISRFCCELNTGVVGGYSKLLKRLPNLDIINFVDRRHGTGKHLLSMGFVLEKIHIGFEWTDNYHHYNRLKFLGNTGYLHGMKKYYDYGQIKYVKKKT